MWYDYVEPKYAENVKLCNMDTDSLIFHIRADDIYNNVVKDVETRFDNSNLEIGRSLPKGKLD